MFGRCVLYPKGGTKHIEKNIGVTSCPSEIFELSYYVRDAGWFATYDFRVQDVSSPIDIAFKANVFQHSGEDWQELNLLDGEVNIFFEGAYLGRSLVDTRNVSDTLEVSLGQDKGIVVRREKIKDFSDRKFLGSNRTDTRAFEIFVKNNKQQPVKITVQDQFPISTQKEISVEDLKYDGAQIDDQTKILTWNFELEPREEKRLEMRYSVKYPKKKVVVLE